MHLGSFSHTFPCVCNSELATLKPNWQPKADIPSAVPKLPPEYIHRHRLMKQVVNSLLERSGGGPVDTDEEVPVRELNAISINSLCLVCFLTF